jgi:hypothetical protein
LARQVTITQAVPPHDPQPLGTSYYGSAPNLSTEKLKLSLWGPPEALTLSVGKTDVWDRRCFQERPLTLADIQQLVQAGKLPPAEHYASWRAHDSPCPKPVGQIILRCADLAGATPPTVVTLCHSGIRTVDIRNNSAHVVCAFLPMMTANLIAIQCECEGVNEPLSVRLYRHQDTLPPGKSMAAYGGPDPRPFEGYDYAKDQNNGPIPPPASGTDGECFWLRQRLPAEITFPQGFEYVMAARVLGPRATIQTIDDARGLGTPPEHNALQLAMIREKRHPWQLLPFYEAIRQARGSAATATLAPKESLRFTVLVTVVTSAEARDPLAEAQRRLRTSSQDGFGKLREENTQWHRGLYEKREKGRIFVNGASSSRDKIADLFTSWRFPHSGNCVPDPARYEADAHYAYLEQDWAPWHGLPCYNELYYTRTHVENRSETLAPFYQLVRFWLPACQANAQEVFHLPGALIQHGYLPPVKPERYIHTTSVWEFCMEIPAQMLKVLWDAYDYGGDEEFLASTVYPAMRELALFYSHYASLGQDGYYHVVPTVSAEMWGWTKDFERNRDTTSALCMFKWLLRTAASAAEALKQDQDLSSRWRDIAAHLAPYPTFPTPEGPVFTDVSGVNPIGVAYNFFAGVTPALLADEINLDSPPAEREMMLRTARLVEGWVNSQVGVVLGAEKGTESEQVLNSRSGRIHLFPAIPPKTTVAFRDLQARGGFEVSAECVEGKITYVRLHARRNAECRLMNPWPGQEVRVADELTNQPIPHQTKESRGDCIVFEARSGAVYVVSRFDSAKSR